MWTGNDITMLHIFLMGQHCLIFPKAWPKFSPRLHSVDFFQTVVLLAWTFPQWGGVLKGMQLCTTEVVKSENCCTFCSDGEDEKHWPISFRLLINHNRSATCESAARSLDKDLRKRVQWPFDASPGHPWSGDGNLFPLTVFVLVLEAFPAVEGEMQKLQIQLTPLRLSRLSTGGKLHATRVLTAALVLRNWLWDGRKCQRLVRLRRPRELCSSARSRDLLRTGAGPTVLCSKIESPQLPVLL